MFYYVRNYVLLCPELCPGILRQFEPDRLVQIIMSELCFIMSGIMSELCFIMFLGRIKQKNYVLIMFYYVRIMFYYVFLCPLGRT